MLGFKVIHDALGRRTLDHEPVIERQPIGLLVITAIGTSIDAMAIGVTLALINANIVTAAGAIGITSVALSTAGVNDGPDGWALSWSPTELAGACCLLRSVSISCSTA
jgi:putative Mn2+ efflux pump MntP